jgi:hypothetical protein
MADDRPAINRMVGTTTIYGKHGNNPAHDNLLLPTGKRIADSSLDEIRSVMAALGVENAFVDGRAVLCARYHELISGIYDAAGMAAVKKYLEDKQKC